MSILRLSTALRLVYIFARDSTVFLRMRSLHIFAIIERLMESHGDEPSVAAPCCMAMGNIAFHEKSARALDPFYRLAIRTMSRHIHNHLVTDSALWMIANYFSASGAQLDGAEAIALIAECLRTFPGELKLNCECCFALFNLCCPRENVRYRLQVLDAGILEILLDRIVTFATTEFIVPCFDVISCLSWQRASQPILFSRLHRLIAVRIPIIPIVNHVFKSTSSFSPMVWVPVLWCLGSRLQGNELELCTREIIDSLLRGQFSLQCSSLLFIFTQLHHREPGTRRSTVYGRAHARERRVPCSGRSGAVSV